MTVTVSVVPADIKSRINTRDFVDLQPNPDVSCRLKPVASTLTLYTPTGIVRIVYWPSDRCGLKFSICACVRSSNGGIWHHGPGESRTTPVNDAVALWPNAASLDQSNSNNGCRTCESSLFP